MKVRRLHRILTGSYLVQEVDEHECKGGNHNKHQHMLELHVHHFVVGILLLPLIVAAFAVQTFLNPLTDSDKALSTRAGVSE